MNPKILPTVGAAILACAQALAATPPAASTGPWAQVPALPTACYSSQDQWRDQNYAAIEAMQETLSAQRDKNMAVEQAANQAFNDDPMAMAQAIQQTMLDDPANAQKMMERMTQIGQEAQTEVREQSEKEKQLEAESKSLLQKYKAALDKASQPAVARWHAVQKKVGWEPGGEVPLGPDPSWSVSMGQEWVAIVRDLDAAYVANCASWWSATGGFQDFMQRYKNYLVQERIPYEKKLVDEPALSNFKLLGVSADGYRTTTDIEAAIDYMKMASSLYGERWDVPLAARN